MNEKIKDVLEFVRGRKQSAEGSLAVLDKGFKTKTSLANWAEGHLLLYVSQEARWRFWNNMESHIMKKMGEDPEWDVVKYLQEVREFLVLGVMQSSPRRSTNPIANEIDIEMRQVNQDIAGMNTLDPDSLWYLIWELTKKEFWKQSKE